MHPGLIAAGKNNHITNQSHQPVQRRTVSQHTYPRRAFIETDGIGAEGGLIFALPILSRAGPGQVLSAGRARTAESLARSGAEVLAHEDCHRQSFVIRTQSLGLSLDHVLEGGKAQIQTSPAPVATATASRRV